MNVYRCPVLVRKIKHLTDARYFAAMGVDWISMELTDDPESFARWHTLRDWVEGVKLAAEIDHHNESLFARTMIDAKPDGVILHSLDEFQLQDGVKVFIDNLSGNTEVIPPGYFQIIPLSGLNETMILDPNIFIQAHWDAGLIRQLIEKQFKGGICLEGTREDAVGMQDYSAYDELFDNLHFF